MKIIIRNMQQEDIDSIMKIEEEAFGEYHWSKNSFTSEIKNDLGHYFVAADPDNSNILGYCGMWNVLEEGHITTVAVHPDFRKNKIGEHLLQKIIDTGYENNIKWFTLEVRAGNIPAMSLYKKYGFENIGVRERYYQDNNEDAIIMWTENIWSDKFKENYKKLKTSIESGSGTETC